MRVMSNAEEEVYRMLAARRAVSVMVGAVIGR
jgi:hypothetical protein